MRVDRSNLVKTLGVALFAATLSVAANAQEKPPIKIGVIGPFSGPAGVLGKHMLDAFQLGVQTLGGTLGGRKAELIIADDQLKPDVGVQIVRRMLERDKIDLLVGLTYSNITMAIYQTVVESKTILILGNSAPSPIAGEKCSPYIFSAGLQNEMNSVALAQAMNNAGFKNVYYMGPNYQASTDMVTGIKRDFKGTVVKEVFTPLTQMDYSAELAELRAAKPDALAIFYPGAFGVAFIKQFSQSGLKGQIPLYNIATTDGATLPAMGKDALGAVTVAAWVPSLDTPGNKKFVDDFEEAYKYIPSSYAATSYDEAFLIDSALKATNGDTTDKMKLIKALETVSFPSIRGKVRFNTNHMLIQNFYDVEVAEDAKGRVSVRSRGIAVPDIQDPNVSACHMQY